MLSKLSFSYYIFSCSLPDCASHALYHDEALSCTLVDKTSGEITMEKLSEQVIHFAELSDEEKKMIHKDIQPTVEDDEEDEEEEEEEKPQLECPGLTVEMLRYQKEGLYWAVKRENDPNCNGGVLADEMGMGKTLQMIALSVYQVGKHFT